MTMALTDATAPPARKGPSLMIQGVVLLVLTGTAIGMGWFAGGYLGKEAAIKGGAEATSAAPTAGGHGAPAKGGGHGEAPAGEHGEPAGNPLLIDLAPMTTNLAAPSQTWVRTELSLVLDAPQPPDLIETVHQDLFAYLRTVKLHQIESASGYQHLKADLEERAALRSDGHVKSVLIRTLLFE